MTHTLRIESDEAVRLANDLVSMTGESLEAAVTTALRQRLEHERVVRERVAKITESAKAFRAAYGEPLGSSDHSWLYDENGLPA